MPAPVVEGAGATAVLRTERLVLRPWRDDDLVQFAAMSADLEVMRWIGAPLTREQSDAVAARIRAGFEKHGFGLLAVDVPGEATFAGFVGLSVPAFEAHFTPCVEIGWRLARVHQGRGYASEGALAVLAYAFGELGLDEVVSFTAASNEASRRVMERIGLARDPSGDFEHPWLAAGHPLRSHVLYRCSRRAFEARAHGARAARAADPR
jgi:RimJ/RimL family protein N-acetyltransferase